MWSRIHLFGRPNTVPPLPPRVEAPVTPPPERPPSPSLNYHPRTDEDRQISVYLESLVEFRENTDETHPAIPSERAGKVKMTSEEVAATRIFRGQYQAVRRLCSEHKTVDDVRKMEFRQTYRKDGNEIVANQSLMVGEKDRVDAQSGMYPPHTLFDIHSHPDIPHPLLALPSEADYGVAHANATNALHREGTNVKMLLYYPPTDTFFRFSVKREGTTGIPQFHQLSDRHPNNKSTEWQLTDLRMPIPVPNN
jgi:hypothetical protein